jgi:dihydroorotate dehydrogenase electron transfer subunit
MSGPEPKRPHRGTIFVEDAEVISHAVFPGEQYVLTLHAPRIAAAAEPGSFAHLTCDEALPMRRPLSIMSADRHTGRVEFLYKIVGEGLRLLARARPGERLSVMGPIGRPFTPDPERTRPLLVGGGVGIPPMVFLAERLAADERAAEPLVLMGSEIPFPFETVAAKTTVPGLPDAATSTLSRIEAIGVACRLASGAGYEGCYRGFVTALARDWIAAQSDGERSRIQVFACGPEPMLEAAARVAREFDLPCQLSLEEYMACAVGGCAGCAVRVQTPDGPAMKRVCVDGPVFEASAVYP